MERSTLLLTDVYSLHAADMRSDGFTWSGELKQILPSDTVRLLLSWPTHFAVQHLMWRSVLGPQAKRLPHFKDLLRTITCGSLVYNSCFLEILPVGRPAAKCFIADLTALIILIGDEFIDGVAQETGKPYMQQLLAADGRLFRLQLTKQDGHVGLGFANDILASMPERTMQHINPKYGITYRELLLLLMEWLEVLNKRIDGLRRNRREAVALKIIAACNACIDTYLHDVNDEPEQDLDCDQHTILRSHAAKNRDILRHMLELRCLLIGRPQLMRCDDLEQWLDMITIVQCYDDLLDAPADDGFQDNLLLAFAKRYHADEWEWFRANKDQLRSSSRIQPLLIRNMPNSVNRVLGIIRSTMTTLSRRKQLLCDHLLRKNWFIKQDLAHETDMELTQEDLQQVAISMAGHFTQEEITVFITECCLHSASCRKIIYEGQGISNAYLLRFSLMSMKQHQKLAIAARASVSPFSLVSQLA